MNHDQSKPEWNQKKTGSPGLNSVLSASLECRLVYSKWHRFMKRVLFFFSTYLRQWKADILYSVNKMLHWGLNKATKRRVAYSDLREKWGKIRTQTIMFSSCI